MNRIELTATRSKDYIIRFNIMHITALNAGNLFGKTYGAENISVLDVGGQDVNGSLRSYFEGVVKTKYTVLDIEPHSSVDVVMKAGDPFPFEDETFDLIVSTSCFEHDPCFWMTFREMCRVVKKGGHIYVNAPSNGPHHGFPGDNWRFYADAGQALAYWASRTLDNKSYPVTLRESFHITPVTNVWQDYIAIWQRTDDLQDYIVLSAEVKDRMGPLRGALEGAGFKTIRKDETSIKM